MLAGCGSGKFSAKPGGGRDKTTFRYAMETAPTTLDPAKVQDIATIDLLSNVFEGLVSYNAKNEIVGQIAESWVPSEGGRIWTFTIRKNAKFHNGRQVTADDVKWSFERACGAHFNSPTAANYLQDIVGVKDEMAGKAPGISGIRVIDPSHVEFTLDKSRAYFLGKLTYCCAFILAKEAAGPDQINDIKGAIGTGPFKFDKFAPDQQVELAANKDYYLGAPKVERIVLPIVKESSTRLNLFKQGQLDTLGIDRKDLKVTQADPVLGKQLVFQMRPAVFYVGLSMTNYAPFKDRRVRRAFAMAIDRDRICNKLLEGMPVAHGLTAPGVPGYREDYKGLPYDPEGAKKLLAEAGYPGGKGLPPVQFTFKTTAPDSQHVSEGVESSVRQNIGMTVQLSTMDWTAFLDARNKGKFESYFLSWYADYLDPENFLSLLLTSNSPLNHDGYKNPEFDRLCELGDTTTDEAKRLKYYQDAEDIAIQDAARIPIYYQRDAILISPRVKGLESNLFGNLPRRNVYFGD